MEFLLQTLNFSFETRDDDAAIFWARPFNNALNSSRMARSSIRRKPCLFVPEQPILQEVVLLLEAALQHRPRPIRPRETTENALAGRHRVADEISDGVCFACSRCR